MKLFPDIAATPRTIVIETEAGRAELPGKRETARGDVTVGFTEGKVTLTAGATGLRFVALRWEAALPEDCRFLGDAWERGYGEFEWRGFVFDRVMPWYFFALSGV